MIDQHTIEPIRTSLMVRLDPIAAFDLFTEGFDSWWPREHHIGEAEMMKAIIEPRVGGRVYEVGTDGTECDWGRVLTWDRPGRLVVAWQLNGHWQYDPDIEHASEYEVLFTAEAGGGTLVSFEHRNFERHGEMGRGIQEAVGGSGGWPALLGMYGSVAETD